MLLTLGHYARGLVCTGCMMSLLLRFEIVRPGKCGTYASLYCLGTAPRCTVYNLSPQCRLGTAPRGTGYIPVGQQSSCIALKDNQSNRAHTALEGTQDYNIPRQGRPPSPLSPNFGRRDTLR